MSHLNILFYKLTVRQLVNKFSVFTAPQCSSPCSQQPCPQSDAYCCHHDTHLRSLSPTQSPLPHTRTVALPLRRPPSLCRSLLALQPPLAPPLVRAAGGVASPSNPQHGRPSASQSAGDGPACVMAGSGTSHVIRLQEVVLADCNVGPVIVQSG